MSHDCPDCGSAFELEERTAKVRVGTCPGCHRSFTMIPHATSAPGDPAEGGAPDVVVEPMATAPNGGTAGDAADSADEDDDGDDSDTPVCGTCGSDLVFKAADEVTIEVFCPQCNETTRFKAEGAETESAAEAPPPPRPPRDDRRERPPMDRERRYDSMGPPQAKGCRRCGGQIDFQPLPDGGREGVCRNCGNRFRLPPRRDDDRGGGGRRYDGGSRGGGGYRPGGRRGPPRGGGGSRYRDEDRDERPRYRRD
jgi:DNA-directed RNA polymerase subunit RPC12/RpoP